MTNESFPIGHFEPAPYSESQRDAWLNDIRHLPEALEHAISNLDEAQLHRPYRAGGWTVHQLVHHIADSHLNAYIRFRLGLTESNPVIKPYDQDAWVKLNDVKELPVNVSLTLLHALHRRWYFTLCNLTEAEWMRTVYHPEQKKDLTLWHFLGMYSWHSRHHVRHIAAFRERENL